MRDYDDWKLDTPDNHLLAYCKCSWCGEDIYQGEDCLYIDGEYVQFDCIDDYLWWLIKPQTVTAGE